MAIEPHQGAASSRGSQAPVAAAPSDMVAAQALQQLVTGLSESVKVAQTEATKRAEIDTRRQLGMAGIESAERLLFAYFDKIFKERELVFGRLFDELDHARTSGDTAHVADALRGIVDLARETPLKDLLNLSSIRAELASGHVDLGA